MDDPVLTIQISLALIFPSFLFDGVRQQEIKLFSNVKVEKNVEKNPSLYTCCIHMGVISEILT